MTLLNKTGVTLKVVVAISLIALTGCSLPPSRAVEATKTCICEDTGDTNDPGLAHWTGELV